jgi:hypothetical protein
LETIELVCDFVGSWLKQDVQDCEMLFWFNGQYTEQRYCSAALQDAAVTIPWPLSSRKQAKLDLIFYRLVESGQSLSLN